MIRRTLSIVTIFFAIMSSVAFVTGQSEFVAVFIGATAGTGSALMVTGLFDAIDKGNY